MREAKSIERRGENERAVAGTNRKKPKEVSVINFTVENLFSI